MGWRIGLSPCAEKDVEQCGDCGRYYSWDDAWNVCPKGWHLPSDEEWIDLEVKLGMQRSESTKAGWRGNSGCQAPKMLEGGYSGLDLIFCGYLKQLNFSRKNPKYGNVLTGREAFYWSDTEYDLNRAYLRHLTNRLSIERTIEQKNRRLPIRCVKNHQLHDE